ncbi:MAG: type I 3-dehydroquinate dehydratase [Candidatus Altiarchaeales archaeon]|nr:type I 3-dehydroquinate dehydratase [Candidatus Altiarchaeales archaeon]MBD3416714.1 type I 3-dehydroquinate dehydratase [Candidatus Altiarchaeales archaeon]
MSLICVPLMDESLDSQVKSAEGLECDLVEARLDFLSGSPDLRMLSNLKQPLMVTCMPAWEGGRFKGSEEDRFGLLRASLEHADYVTVELRAEEKLRNQLIEEVKSAGVKVVIAFHDFEKTPPSDEIIALLKEEESAGADIAKVAFKPETRADVVEVLRAQASSGLKIPVIALSMGELGGLTRVVGPLLGGFITFAAVSHEKRTAPGQYTLDEMKALKEILWK